jgi:hypothetical protein
MMTNELTNAGSVYAGNPTFTATRSNIFGGSGGQMAAHNAVQPATTPLGSFATVASQKELDPTRKIVSFGTSGDIDDSLTLGDIMQNAYYLASRAYVASQENVAAVRQSILGPLTTATATDQNVVARLNSLTAAVGKINLALTGKSGIVDAPDTTFTTGPDPTILTEGIASGDYSKPMRGNHPSQAELNGSSPARVASKYLVKNANYRWVIGPGGSSTGGQPSSGQQIMTEVNDGMHVLRNAGYGLKPNKFRIKD